VLDHCCTPAQNRRGSLGSGVCGLWTSPVPPWTGFCSRRAASVATSGLGVRGHAATIPEVDVRRRSGPVAKELWWKTADRSKARYSSRVMSWKAAVVVMVWTPEFWRPCIQIHNCDQWVCDPERSSSAQSSILAFYSWIIVSTNDGR